MYLLIKVILGLSENPKHFIVQLEDKTDFSRAYCGTVIWYFEEEYNEIYFNEENILAKFEKEPSQETLEKFRDLYPMYFI